MNVHPDVAALFAAQKVFSEEIARRRLRPQVSVSRAVSVLAFAFERARNSIDYRDDTLLRRAAVARSLTRKFTLSSPSSLQAERLIQELLLARYFPEDFISNDLIENVTSILEKYKKVIRAATLEIRDWLIKIAAVEIDRIFVPPYKEDALTNLFYSALLPQVELGEESPERKERLVYLTAARSAVGADGALLSFLLLNAHYPGWHKNNEQVIAKLAQNLTQTYKTIQEEINHPAKEPLLRYFLRFRAPFLVLHDLAASLDLTSAKSASPQALEEQLVDLYRERNGRLRTRFNRAATRAIIYIFLTKMLFLFLLELPIEKLIFGSLNFRTLILNLALPPGVLFLIVNTAGKADIKNEGRVVSAASEILTSGKLSVEKFTFTPSPGVKLSSLFHFAYGASLVAILVWTMITFLAFGFSLPSTLIMLLFLSLVIFFGFLIRRQAQELTLVSREQVLAPVVNFLSLPFIRAGKFLSGQLVRFNFIVFLVDVFLEAPFKAFFRVAQSGAQFVQREHEEAITQVP